ncbi:MAG: lytic transglycosylase domain-containing protein [Rhodovarius sp.]|nr:lytic transglycosylase domain-containing protein [Rhodovarius sp.]MDW8315955.1 lytic transglycosylase domain-containing protein [Rhodovarius sp.]
MAMRCVSPLCRRVLLRPAALLAILLLLAPPAAAQPAAREAGRLALLAASQNRWAEAEAAAARADPLLRKMVTWLRLQSRQGGASAAEILAFVESAPDWPGLDAIARQMEALLREEPDDQLVLRWFARHAPLTLAGALRQADALARAGRAREAAAAARQGWTTTPGDAEAEAALLSRHAAALTPDDHWARFDRLATARDVEGAQRLLRHLSGEREAIARLRLGYATGLDPAQGAALAARDAGATLERARALRLAGREAEAAAAFAAGEAAQRSASPELARAIWAERQLLARRLLRQGDARSAYRLAAEHGQPGPGLARQEAEFLAGFIALRFLGDARRAEAHFARVAEGAESPITLSRAHYWRGRALAEQNRLPAAREAYQRAAAFPVAFYGQLAALALGEGPEQLAGRILALSLPAPRPAEERAFQARELVRLVLMLGQMGEGRRARVFLLHLADGAREPWERAALIELAARTGQPENPVWVARRLGAAGAMPVPQGWPAPYPTAGLAIEPALINAIIRQESNFDTQAISSANARGLMQLLPATAQAVAQRLRLPHQLDWLTSRPEHNIRLGSHYLAERIERFGGAWPLAIAAYNAGTARVEEWLATYGDPRAPGGPAMLDWLELIPFSETRNYVQRVIENVVVYRALAGQVAPHPLAAWLP